MRWPWTRRPAEPAVRPAPAAAPASARGRPALADGVGVPAADPANAVLPIAPVTRPAEVPSELSAWRSPAFTDSLSHAVVDTAPGGLVDGDGGGLGHPTYTIRART